ncbi:unnamed protein product [Clonostachys rosea]|uniref:Mating-type switching protein swi10 n=1 Tax=Bionectria ochroleuca TaxID=29856 RepID=A0ABY6TWY5_BIOOC|nr:unnamed protein product [Clonostachys rosea]
MLRTSPRTNNKTSPRSRAWWSKRPSEDKTATPEPSKAARSARSQRRNSFSPRYSPVNDPRVVSFLESNALVTGPDGVVVRPPRHGSKPLEIESRWKQVHSPPTQEVQGLGLTSDSSKDSRPNLKKLQMLVKMPSFSSKNHASPKSPHQKSKSEDLRPTWETEDYRPRPYDLRPYDAIKPQSEEPKPLPLTRKMSDLDELAQRYQNMMEVRGESKALPSLPTPPQTPPTESEEPLLLLPQAYSGSPSTSSKSQYEPEPVLRQSRAQRFGASLESKNLKQIDEQGIHPLKAHPWNYLYEDNHESLAAEIRSDSGSSTASESSSPRTFSIGSLSPQSDVTLVAFPQEENMPFKEDAIYFKPVSFGPTPPATPPQDYKPSGTFGSPAIGLGMLAQDMVCSLADASPRADNKFDKMQVQIMIETYERLRDNMTTMGVSQEEMSNAKAVFDCWLSALNSIRCAMGDDNTNECAWI